MSKLPTVGLLFWTIKIVATTLGESVSNFVSMAPLNLGYATGAIIFLVAFVLTLAVQLRVSRFRPVVFWSVILTTSIVGTAMSDFMNRTVGLGYRRRCHRADDTARARAGRLAGDRPDHGRGTDRDHQGRDPVLDGDPRVQHAGHLQR
ncbi:hypothetical protein ACQ4WX_48340 [Streptomyces lasalocidi]